MRLKFKTNTGALFSAGELFSISTWTGTLYASRFWVLICLPLSLFSWTTKFLLEGRKERETGILSATYLYNMVVVDRHTLPAVLVGF